MDDPRAVVACVRLSATLPAYCCASRHALRLPSGGGKGFPRFPGCAACPVGGAVLAALEAGGWQRPRDTIPAVVLEPPQMQARERWRRSFPVHSEPADGRLDALREVAGWTPDDRGIAVDAG